MRPTKIIIISLGFIALAVSTAAHAGVYRRMPGVTCEGLYQNWQKMYREERGILNIDTTQPQGVVCPAKAPDVSTSNETCLGGSFQTSVFYDDESNVDDFRCQMYKVTVTGTMSWGVPRFTCSQAGGCPDPTTAYMGTGYLTLPSLSTTCDGTYANLGAVCVLPRHASPGATFLIYTGTVAPF